MDALKCAMEGDTTFLCHEHRKGDEPPICAGFLLLAKNEGTKMPWLFASDYAETASDNPTLRPVNEKERNMKFWMLNARDDLHEDDDPWGQKHDKMYSCIVRAESESAARRIAHQSAGIEIRSHPEKIIDRNFVGEPCKAG